MSQRVADTGCGTIGGAVATFVCRSTDRVGAPRWYSTPLFVKSLCLWFFLRRGIEAIGNSRRQPSTRAGLSRSLPQFLKFPPSHDIDLAPHQLPATSIRAHVATSPRLQHNSEQPGAAEQAARLFNPSRRWRILWRHLSPALPASEPPTVVLFRAVGASFSERTRGTDATKPRLQNRSPRGPRKWACRAS